ncbi:MAG: chromosome segregation protein SMC [Bacteriovoracaceae bacterium]
MKLKQLIVQGFKSFKDRTVIEFNSGITGIVGPNGCGKSNVVDALFWVMGEQSAKHLRGQSMKDVIFSGSAKYNPGSFAEVSLILNNEEEKHIHIGNKLVKPNEIQLTRKLFRNGESEYLINNTQCRLRDIQEVFMDTGAGAKSYSVIAQGEISRIVSQKPIDRRVMIEEVAGITKFKMRKRDSLKKIDHTNENLNRLQDLKSEIYKNLKILENQAEKAILAKNLKEKVKKYELVVESHREFELLRELKENFENIETLKTQAQEAKTRNALLENSLEEEKIQKLDLIEKLDVAQVVYNEGAKELAKSHEKLNYLKKSSSEKTHQIGLRRVELETLSEEHSERTNKLSATELELARIEENKFEVDVLEELESEVENLENSLSDQEIELKETQNKVKSFIQQEQSIDHDILKNSTKYNDIGLQLDSINHEVETLEKHFANARNQILVEKEEVEKSSLKLSEIKTEASNQKEKIQAAKAEMRELELSLKEKNKEFIQLDVKLNSLKAMQGNLEGSGEHVKKFLKENSEGNYAHVGNLIQCDEKYTKALQVILGEYFDYLVTTDENLNVVSTWANAQGNNVGLSAWIPSSSDIQAIDLSSISKKEIISVSEIIRVDNKAFEKVLKELTRNFFIIDSNDVKDFQAFEASEFGNFCLVNLSGKIQIKKQYSSLLSTFVSSKMGDNGFIERNNLITKLQTEKSQTEVIVAELEQKNRVKQTETEQLETQYQKSLDEIMQLENEVVKKNFMLTTKNESQESHLQKIQFLHEKKSKLSSERLELSLLEEKLSKQKIELTKNIEILSSKEEEFENIVNEMSDELDDKKHELLEKQVSFKGYENNLKNYKSQIEDLRAQLTKLANKMKQNNEFIEQYNTEIENYKSEIQELETSVMGLIEVQVTRENELKKIKNEVSLLENSMSDREEEAKNLTQKYNKLEKEIVQIEVKIEQQILEEEMLVNNMIEKYLINLRTTLVPVTEITDSQLKLLKELKPIDPNVQLENFEFNRRYGADLKECKEKFKNNKSELAKLGDINYQAIVEYDKQKLRYDFLNSQEEDLKRSINDLNLAIKQIDEKSKSRFLEAFNEVNERFEKVFPIIFGGGNAKLVLVGDLEKELNGELGEESECGVEIVAQPPGKKMQNINLMSGGEKAMTAISLIFSIFLVKPSPFCLLDEVDAPLDDANVGRFNELIRELSYESQFIVITHNKKTMELNDRLYGITMQEPGISKAVSVQLN